MFAGNYSKQNLIEDLKTKNSFDGDMLEPLLQYVDKFKIDNDEEFKNISESIRNLQDIVDLLKTRYSSNFDYLSVQNIYYLDVEYLTETYQYVFKITLWDCEDLIPYSVFFTIPVEIETTKKIHKSINLPFTDYYITGTAALTCWDDEEGTIPMKPISLEKLGYHKLLESLNDNGFGCKSINAASVDIYENYSGYHVYKGSLLVGENLKDLNESIKYLLINGEDE